MDRAAWWDVRRGMGPKLALLVLLLLAAATWAIRSAGSAGSQLEVVAVLVFLGASTVAFGVLDRPRRRRRSARDARTAVMAEGVLAGLDGVEHRRVELGAPWPQLSVGPTGVVLIDVCDLGGPIVLDGPDVRRLGGPRACPGCAAMNETEGRVRRALADVAPDMPVRSISVLAPGTAVCATSPSSGRRAVGVDGLADLLARGRVLPMPAVDAAFAALSRTPVFDGR